MILLFYCLRVRLRYGGKLNSYIKVYTKYTGDDSIKKQYYLDCIDKAITLYWRTLASARGMKLYTEDFDYVLSENREEPERIFNINIPIENLEIRLDEIVKKIDKGLLPDSFLITPNTRPENLCELLNERGFEPDYSGLCMVTDLDNFKSNGFKYVDKSRLCITDGVM